MIGACTSTGLAISRYLQNEKISKALLQDVTYFASVHCLDAVFLTAAFWCILLYVCAVSLHTNFCHLCVIKIQMVLFTC